MQSFPETRRGPHGISRRDVLRAGCLGAVGLSLADLLRRPAQAAPDTALDRTFGRAKNLLFLFLAGGPSQYETFDPKPDAPTGVRGIFQPIATNVNGVRICELLPRTARITDKLCIVRSMYTGDPNHESGGYWVNTGHAYRGANMRAVHPTDWPTFGSIVKMLKPSPTVPFTSVVLPEPIIANPWRLPARSERRLSWNALGSRVLPLRPVLARLPYRGLFFACRSAAASPVRAPRFVAATRPGMGYSTRIRARVGSHRSGHHERCPIGAGAGGVSVGKGIGLGARSLRQG